MYSSIVGRVVGFLYGKVSKGDLRLPLLGLAKDARLFFPGNNSFGGEHRGKPAIEALMRRFASPRPEVTLRDVAGAGPPRDMRGFMRFCGRIVAPHRYLLEKDGVEALRNKNGPLCANRDP